MSSIDYIKREVVWTDANSLGLHDTWADEMRAAGYKIFDLRKGGPYYKEAANADRSKIKGN